MSPYSYLQRETGWLLALGQRLRVEYDAIAEPMPPRITALLEQLRTTDGEAIHGREERKALFRRTTRAKEVDVGNSATSLYQG